jgi:acrylyl-CoA reductase (NADPH)
VVKAFVINEVDGIVDCAVREVSVEPRDPTDICVDVDYSGVNYKDVMVASAPSRVRPVATLIGGVDAAGVVRRGDGHVTKGTRVAVHGGDLGVARDGGFSSEIYTPSRYLSALPSELSTSDAMAIGTAGFTAMASVLALEHFGLERGARVLVTGATGGVGCQAVAYLAKRGYEPVASTGSSDATAWLHDLGARDVIGRHDISDRRDRVLASQRWDGAIDCVGGSTLVEVLRSLRYGSAVAASGIVASAELSTSLYPFITRGVALIGIDAVDAPSNTREKVWRALGDLATSLDFSILVDRVK